MSYGEAFRPAPPNLSLETSPCGKNSADTFAAGEVKILPVSSDSKRKNHIVTGVSATLLVGAVVSGGGWKATEQLFPLSELPVVQEEPGENFNEPQSDTLYTIADTPAEQREEIVTPPDDSPSLAYSDVPLRSIHALLRNPVIPPLPITRGNPTPILNAAENDKMIHSFTYLSGSRYNQDREFLDTSPASAETEPQQQSYTPQAIARNVFRIEQPNLLKD